VSQSSQQLNSFSRHCARFAVTHRLLLLLGSIVLTGLLALGILRSGFDTSLGALLTQSDPYLDEMAELEEQFPDPLQVTFAFIPMQTDTVFEPAVLDAIADLSEHYTDIPHTDRFTSLIDYFSPETQTRLFEQPYNDYSASELLSLRDKAINDRLLTNNLLANDASLTFANVVIEDTELSDDEHLKIANAALALREELRARHPGLTIHVNSEVILEQSSEQAMVDDLTQLLPFVILACVLAICYCFRSATLGICILTHTIFTLLCTVGVFGYAGLAFNTISIIAPLVVVIIAVANSVHLISIFNQARHRGDTKLDAMAFSIAYNLQPISLAALTTAIGFASLNLCSSPAIQDFGTIVAVGIAFAYLLTLTVQPALLIWLSKAIVDNDPSRAPFLQDSLKRLVAFTLSKDKTLFWGFSALSLVTLLLLPLNETDFNRLDFIAADGDIRDFYDEVGARMNRGPALTYAIDTGAIDGAIEPRFLQQVDAFLTDLQARGDIETAASVTDVVKTVNRVQHQEDPAYYTLPDDIDTIAAYLNGYEAVQSEDFPLLGFINADFSMITLFFNATPMSNQSLIDLDLELTAEFEAQFADAFPEARLLHGSGILLFSRMDELVTTELLEGYSLSLLLITLSLIIGLRSVFFGILSILPNLFPATIVFGFWALIVGKLDPFVMMLFSISIGLVVDDTAHILSHYLEGRREGKDKQDAIAHSIRTAGPALIITTLILALGTTILIGASTIYFQQAAKLLVPIVIIALVLDLLYLPSILLRFDRQKPAENAVAN
jgi:predicted RND superfamily exporter protein